MGKMLQNVEAETNRKNRSPFFDRDLF